jgi:hypothetical protein
LSNGVSPFAPLTKPGYGNFDTALFKNFLVKERFAVQFRLESYNTLNHPEFSGFDAGAKFSSVANGSVQQNGTFGQLNDSAGPRVLQLAGRINF